MVGTTATQNARQNLGDFVARHGSNIEALLPGDSRGEAIRASLRTALESVAIAIARFNYENDIVFPSHWLHLEKVNPPEVRWFPNATFRVTIDIKYMEHTNTIGQLELSYTTEYCGFTVRAKRKNEALGRTFASLLNEVAKDLGLERHLNHSVNNGSRVSFVEKECR